MYQDVDYLYLSQYSYLDHQSIADCDDTAFEAGTLTWQDPVQSWKAGPGLNGIMTLQNLSIISTVKFPTEIFKFSLVCQPQLQWAACLLFEIYPKVCQKLSQVKGALPTKTDFVIHHRKPLFA